MQTTVWCTTQFEGFHYWPNAPEEVAFLRQRHRHIFHVRLEMTVSHADREVEFILLKRELEAVIKRHIGANTENVGSCEMMAAAFSDWFKGHHADRTIICTVSEDGENGATGGRLTVWYFPLEGEGMRYHAEMDRALFAAFDQAGLSYVVVHGSRGIGDELAAGRFLDPTTTSYFKATQLSNFVVQVAVGNVKRGDIIYLADLWYPGIQSIAYLSHLRNLDFKIGGFLHAGSFTPHDYVAAMGAWAKPFEKSILTLAQFVFVGSKQTQDDLVSGGLPAAVHVTGLPLDLNLPVEAPKEDIVVFPHRLAPEKRPEWFDALAGHFPQAQFIKTHELQLPKQEYYQLLARSKVVFSAALEETFGIAVIEACALGNVPVLPLNDFTCYRYMYPSSAFYSTTDQAVEMVAAGLAGKGPTYREALRFCTEAGAKQAQVLRGLA